jgi:dihydrofolate reductase
LQHNLMDELHLLVYPLVMGSGTRLVPQGSDLGLRLVDTRTFSSGVIALTYQPASVTK